jgi:hypothetical protein
LGKKIPRHFKNWKGGIYTPVNIAFPLGFCNEDVIKKKKYLPI